MTLAQQPEFKSYTGAYIMYLSDGKLTIPGRKNFKNFKAVFPLHEVDDYLSRSRPHTPAPGTMTNPEGIHGGQNCDQCDEWDAAVDELTRLVYFKTKRMDVRSLVAEAAFSVRQDHNWMQRHDAETARAATLKATTFIRKFVAEHPLDGSCPFDKMNSDECLNIRDGQCEVCVVDHAIESHRQQAGEQE